MLLADSALAAELPGRRAADTHQVIVHVDAAALGDPAADGRSELEHAGNVSAETSRRLACDASVVEVVEDDAGDPLSVGRRRRTVPPALRRALANRDAACRFPGCAHTRFLEAHHVTHWANGGETSLDNLVHLCSFHPRALHEGGYRVSRTDGGELRFTSTYGLVVREVPDGPAAGSVDELVRAHASLDIQARKLPLWDGAPMDYGMTVTALLLAE